MEDLILETSKSLPGVCKVLPVGRVPQPQKYDSKLLFSYVAIKNNIFV